MRLVKRLYIFILQSFLPLFAMTFFIVLFIVLMQFLWKHLDDLVGKGLPISLIGELFFYAGVSMVPMALPLAILLASLMTFGNFGEKFELTAMKASGISLLRAMRPLIVFIALISVGAFFFQNDVLPPAQVKMWTLLFSMRQKSPEVEIPEGVFYDQIPGYNLLVQSKNRENGMLYDMMIYDVTRGGDNATILVADSGKMAFTADMKYLYLHLFTGEQFENLREQKALDRNVPFRREKFKDKEILIPFDANFNRLDEEGMRNQYVGKNIKELHHTMDSIGERLDSTGKIYTEELKNTAFPLLRERRTPDRPLNRNFSRDHEKENENVVEEAVVAPVNLDSLLLTVSRDKLPQIFDNAVSISKRRVNDYQFKALTVNDDKFIIRRHEIELLKKYTLSVACLIFFFIGAPLGAIIRKGGLGTPLVISVLLFIFYYIIDNAGYKMARDGKWEVWFGIWLSTFVLAPLGVYVTYKAMNDSSVFDPDVYKNLFRKLRGVRETRKVESKEVIINEVDKGKALSLIEALEGNCEKFISSYGKRLSYKEFFQKGYDIRLMNEIGHETDKIVDYLSNSRNPKVIELLSEFPIMKSNRKDRFHKDDLLTKIYYRFLPVGAVFYLLSIREHRIFMEDLEKIRNTSEEIKNIILDREEGEN